MDNPIKANEKIRIHSVTGGDERDQNDLLNCYFAQLGNPGDYAFYNQANQQIFTAPSLLHGSTRTFRFIYGGFLWTVDNFHLDFTTPRSTAGGHWVNDHEVPTQDEGEFHAQSGGGAQESATYAGA
jgi:hypothetical protein